MGKRDCVFFIPRIWSFEDLTKIDSPRSYVLKRYSVAAPLLGFRILGTVPSTSQLETFLTLWPHVRSNSWDRPTSHLKCIRILGTDSVKSACVSQHLEPSQLSSHMCFNSWDRPNSRPKYTQTLGTLPTMILSVLQHLCSSQLLSHIMHTNTSPGTVPTLVPSASELGPSQFSVQPHTNT